MQRCKLRRFALWHFTVLLPQLGLMGIMLLQPRTTYASLPFSKDKVYLTSVAEAPNGGFWIQQDSRDSGRAAGTYAINDAPNYGSFAEAGVILSVPHSNGYWIITPTGRIVVTGDAPVLCGWLLQNCSGFRPDSGGNIVAAAATPDGKGLWAVGIDGSVWTAGTAQSYGDVDIPSWNWPKAYYPAAIAPTPSGKGYVILLTNGVVKAFGDARTYNAPAAAADHTAPDVLRSHEATGIAWSLDSSGKANGYWIVEDDGGVFVHGAAPFLGSSGGDDGGSKVVNIVSLNKGRSYAWIHQDGRLDFSRPPASALGDGRTDPAENNPGEPQN